MNSDDGSERDAQHVFSPRQSSSSSAADETRNNARTTEKGAPNTSSAFAQNDSCRHQDVRQDSLGAAASEGSDGDENGSQSDDDEKSRSAESVQNAELPPAHNNRFPLLKPRTPTANSSYLTLTLQRVGLKDYASYVQPFVSVTVCGAAIPAQDLVCSLARTHRSNS